MAVTFPKFTVSAVDYFFIDMLGDFPEFALTSEEITRNGVNGHAYKKAGLRGQQYTLTVTTGTNGAAAAEIERVRYATWQSELITVVHDVAGSFTNQFVVNVLPSLPKKVEGASTSYGTVTHIFRTQFTLQDTRTS
jgi:hypothetical protein